MPYIDDSIDRYRIANAIFMIPEVTFISEYLILANFNKYLGQQKLRSNWMKGYLRLSRDPENNTHLIAECCKWLSVVYELSLRVTFGS